MPSSRKRNKGRARKKKPPKKEAQQQQQRGRQQNLEGGQLPPSNASNDAPGLEARIGQQIAETLDLAQEIRAHLTSTCSHGAPLISKDIFEFILHFECQLLHQHAGLHATIQSMPSPAAVYERVVKALHGRDDLINFWKDADAREKIVVQLVSFGANYLVHGNEQFANMACVIGIWVIVMEKGRHAMGIEHPSLQWAIRNLIADKERGVTRFFASRLKCSCLKEKSQRVKADPKLGHCDYCKEEKERTELKVCSRCKIQHYCSEACQRSHWREDHKRQCALHGVRRLGTLFMQAQGAHDELAARSRDGGNFDEAVESFDRIESELLTELFRQQSL